MSMVYEQPKNVTYRRIASHLDRLVEAAVPRQSGGVITKTGHHPVAPGRWDQSKSNIVWI
jgi:hypothetical protein